MTFTDNSERRTSVHPMQQIDDIGFVAASMPMLLNEDDYGASHYVHTPWGLFDIHTQSFKAT